VKGRGGLKTFINVYTLYNKPSLYNLFCVLLRTQVVQLKCIELNEDEDVTALQEVTWFGDREGRTQTTKH